MDELLTKQRDLSQETLHLRLQQQTGQLEKPSSLRYASRRCAHPNRTYPPQQAGDKKK